VTLAAEWLNPPKRCARASFWPETTGQIVAESAGPRDASAGKLGSRAGSWDRAREVGFIRTGYSRERGMSDRGVGSNAGSWDHPVRGPRDAALESLGSAGWDARRLGSKRPDDGTTSRWSRSEDLQVCLR
jgi:hypothetical protein